MRLAVLHDLLGFLELVRVPKRLWGDYTGVLTSVSCASIRVRAPELEYAPERAAKLAVSLLPQLDAALRPVFLPVGEGWAGKGCSLDDFV